MKIPDLSALAADHRDLPSTEESQSEAPQQPETLSKADLVEIRGPREKLVEIRDWHRSKASVAWSFETRDRHEAFANWLDQTLQDL